MYTYIQLLLYQKYAFIIHVFEQYTYSILKCDSAKTCMI